MTIVYVMLANKSIFYLLCVIVLRGDGVGREFFYFSRITDEHVLTRTRIKMTVVKQLNELMLDFEQPWIGGIYEVSSLFYMLLLKVVVL